MPAAWISAGVGAIGLISSMSSDSGGGGSSSSSASTYDPYAQYRGAAATQLNSLMADPGSATNSSYGQALQTGAERSMAAQGYTGSGNAIVAAANAGGQAYQQQFNNLSMLSGASQGPAQGAGLAAQQGNINQQNSNQMWNQLGGLAQNIYTGYNNSSGGSSGSNDSYISNNGGSSNGWIGGNGTGGYGMENQSSSNAPYGIFGQ